MEEKFNYIYARESTKAQAKDGYNLVEQERKCRSYIDLEGWKEPIQVLTEFGKSAKTLNRPEMNKLISDIKEKKVKRLIVYKLDRLVRRLSSLQIMLNLIQEYNVVFVSVAEKIDTTTAVGRLFINLIVTFAEWEQDTISERTVDGMIGGALLGNYIKGGKNPFGFRRIKRREIIETNGKLKDVRKVILEKHEEEFTLVKQMYQWAIEGYSILRITYLLNESDYMKNNNKIMSEHAVRNIIHNTLYCGIMKFQGIDYVLDIEKVVSFDEYNLALKILSRRANVKKNDYLYKNKVMCKCGELCLQEVTNKRVSCYKKYYLYYKCPKCNKRINEKMINRYVLPSIVKEFKLFKKNVMIEKMRCEVERLYELRECLYDMFMNNEIKKDTYITGLMKCERDLEKVEEEYQDSLKKFELSFDTMEYSKKIKIIVKCVKKVIIDFDMKCVVKIEKK